MAVGVVLFSFFERFFSFFPLSFYLGGDIDRMEGVGGGKEEKRVESFKG